MFDPRPRKARRSAGRGRLVTMVASGAGHALIFLALVAPRAEPPRPAEVQPIEVTLVEPPPPPPASPVKPDAPPEPSPEKPPPRLAMFRLTPKPPPRIKPLPAGEAKSTQDGVVEVSDAELAGAATAGSGSPGGACNMPRWLQSKLRQDPQVRAAVAEAHRGKAIRVWNGDWVRHPGQEGDGLAAVREVLMWEIAFAPEPCRAEPVRGLVMLSLNDGPGSARIVVGSGRWRWSDLLFSRSGAAVTSR